MSIIGAESQNATASSHPWKPRAGGLKTSTQSVIDPSSTSITITNLTKRVQTTRFSKYWRNATSGFLRIIIRLLLS
ncbi:unnamed protein product [Leptidea sinapis]|uniref:Uncharacterized protein n=1 Tax=Leptidea sinapis TaxID=189913 RepID=A0A5E4QQT6_9NEOP|nr:unnamed protein product [Leptidea sinapis]